jgi:hypothetical protein
LGLIAVIIGGVLGATAGYFQEATKGHLLVAFPTGRETDLYLNATPPIMKYIKDKVDRGLKVEGRLHFLPNNEFFDSGSKNSAISSIF